jgi:hypothetical protein
MENVINGTVVAGLVVLVMAALNAPQVWYAYASRRWPTATARLHLAAPLINDESYEPIVRYSYEVNGVAYEGKRFRFGVFPSMDRNLAAHTLTKAIDPINPVVFYDPHDPERACLVPGCNDVTLFFPVLTLSAGLALLILGLSGHSLL